MSPTKHSLIRSLAPMSYAAPVEQMMPTRETRCPVCKGTGTTFEVVILEKRFKDDCWYCAGSGVDEVEP